jgi:hypothetical protein
MIEEQKKFMLAIQTDETKAKAKTFHFCKIF